MSLITLIIVIVVVGLVLWFINAYIPMDPKIKTFLNVAVIIFLIIWFLIRVSGRIGDIRI